MFGVPAPAPERVEPALHVGKAISVCHAVDQQGGVGAPEIGPGDSAVSLLPRGVPDLDLDCLLSHLLGPDFEVDAYRGDEGGGEVVFGVAEEEARLAGPAVPDQDDLH